MTTNGRVVWVAYRPRYGTLDGAMIRYDTQTGEAAYRNAALPNEHILFPMWDADTGQLIAGTSFLSDCGTAEPVRDDVYAVTLDPVTMEVTRRVRAPEGLDHLRTIGPLGERKWLMRSAGLMGMPRNQWQGATDRVGVFDEAAGTFSTDSEMTPLPENASDIRYAGTPGLFLLNTPYALKLWRFRKGAVSDVARFRKGYVWSACVHGKSVYCDCVRNVAVLRNVLP